MYLAMNRFRVKLDCEEQWEQIWKQRESYLASVPGFVQFMLLRGAEAGDYISFSEWQDEAAFHAWTRSESFRLAHGAGLDRRGPRRSAGARTLRARHHRNPDHPRDRQHLPSARPPGSAALASINITEARVRVPRRRTCGGGRA